MTKKMTVVFHDEELYTDLKIEAVRLGKPASEIVAEAVRDWLIARESEELLPLHEAAMKEAEEKGFISWEEVNKRLVHAKKDKKQPLLVADSKNV